MRIASRYNYDVPYGPVVHAKRTALQRAGALKVRLWAGADRVGAQTLPRDLDLPMPDMHRVDLNPAVLNKEQT
jgi:hypothetical protein